MWKEEEEKKIKEEEDEDEKVEEQIWKRRMKRTMRKYDAPRTRR